MRDLSILLTALLLTLNISAQKTVRMDAVKANNYGIAYSLPKSALEVTIEYAKKTQTAGEFYMYAERYLNISNPITQNNVEYELNKITANTIGIPDPDNSYLVEFRPNSATAYITLTQDGLLCAINADYTFAKEDVAITKQPATNRLNPKQYFTEEILRAGSSAKQAELVAKQIYKIRESRNDILVGDADNMPPDGDAYKLVMQQLDEQEAALTSLFAGKEEVQIQKKVVRVDDLDSNISDRVISRFSKKLGIVEANNLAGEAIYLTLKAKGSIAPMVLNEREEKEREKKFSRGIIYNIPGKATLNIEFGGKTLINKECDIVQFGSKEVLDQKEFGDKNNPLKVVFYPELGAIKQTGLAL